MIKENKSKYAILGMLSLGPMSGYDIKKLIESSISYFWSESYGQIYPMLKQTVADGLATVHSEESQGKPDRYVYTLTEKGLDELRHWISEPGERPKFRSELLLKLYFGGQVSARANLRLVEETRLNLLDSLKTYEATEQVISKQAKRHHNQTDPVYWLITLRFGQYHTRAYIEWCEETIKTLKELIEIEETKTVD